MEEYGRLLEEANNEIDFYKDGEKLVKFADLKQKEKLSEAFNTAFVSEKETLQSQQEALNNEINDISHKLNRCLRYLNVLKQISDVSTG